MLEEIRNKAFDEDGTYNYLSGRDCIYLFNMLDKYKEALEEIRSNSVSTFIGDIANRALEKE